MPGDLVLTGTGGAPNSPITLTLTQRVEVQWTRQIKHRSIPSSKSRGSKKPIIADLGQFTQLVVVEATLEGETAAGNLDEAIETWWEYGEITLTHDLVHETNPSVKVGAAACRIDEYSNRPGTFKALMTFAMADRGIKSIP